jgi:hypothetical protein
MSLVTTVYLSHPTPTRTAHLFGPVDEPAMMAAHILKGHAIMGIGGDIYRACMDLLATDADLTHPRIASAWAFNDRRLAARFGA